MKNFLSLVLMTLFMVGVMVSCQKESVELPAASAATVEDAPQFHIGPNGGGDNEETHYTAIIDIDEDCDGGEYRVTQCFDTSSECVSFALAITIMADRFGWCLNVHPATCTPQPGNCSG